MNLTFLYVAAIYSAAVWLGRRSRNPLPWRTAGFFYLLVLLFLFRPMTQAFVNIPADFLRTLPPWRSLGLAQVQNIEINDVILQIVPWAHLVREAWLHLDFPLWNATAAGGYPLLANGQSAAFSLFRVLALPLSLGDSFTFESAGKLLLALSFGYLYMRRRGHSELAALITSISFAFSTAIIVWLQFPLGTVTAFLPMVLYAIDLLFEHRSYPRFLLLVLAFWQMLLNGHPETAAHTVFVAVLYVLFILASEWSGDHLRAAGSMAGAGVIALLLSLPFILPFLEALPYTHRYDALQEYPKSLVENTDATFLVNFLQPRFFGSVSRGTAWGPAYSEALAGYCGVFAVAAWFAMLMDMVKRRAWRRRTLFYVAGTPLVLGVIFGIPGIIDAFRAIPLFEIAANGRMRFVICWFLSVLAGEAVDLTRERTRLPMGIGLAVGFASLLAAFFLNDVIEHGLASPVIRTSIPAVVVLVVAAFAVRNAMRSTLLAALLVVAITADLLAFGFAWTPVVPKNDLYPGARILSALERLQRKDVEPAPYRTAGTGPMFFPNSSSMYDLEGIRGHDPMANGRVLGMLRVLTGYSSEEYFGMLDNVDHPFIDFLNVRYVLTTGRETLDPDHYRRVYSGHDGRIWINRHFVPRFFPAGRVVSQFNDDRRIKQLLELRDWNRTVVVKRLPSQVIDLARKDLFRPRADDAPRATVRITDVSSRTFGLAIDAPRWTLIASSQPHFPGWRIFRDGGEELKVVTVDEAFMGFIAPPGRYRVTVRYLPMSFSVGLGVALFTALLLLSAPFVRRRWRDGVWFRLREDRGDTPRER